MIQQDKLYHFIASFFIVLIVTAILITCGMDDKARCIAIASLTSMLTGMAKEIYDKFIKHSKFDIKDLIADFIGLVSAAVYLSIIL